MRLIDEQPRKGAHGNLIAFLHPKSTGGVLIELCQRDELRFGAKRTSICGLEGAVPRQRDRHRRDVKLRIELRERRCASYQSSARLRCRGRAATSGASKRVIGDALRGEPGVERRAHVVVKIDVVDEAQNVNV